MIADLKRTFLFYSLNEAYNVRLVNSRILLPQRDMFFFSYYCAQILMTMTCLFLDEGVHLQMSSRVIELAFYGSVTVLKGSVPGRFSINKIPGDVQ